jgi:cell division septum initiation protein DivIVA
MSNVNNYKFASQLDLYKSKEVDALAKNVEDAKAIMADTKRVWDSATQKESAQARLDQMKERLARLQYFHAEGMELVKQHEALVNSLSRWYDLWWQNISNEGRQEVELMSSQADMLQQIFVEIWKELKPLNLDIKIPNGMNL